MAEVFEARRSQDVLELKLIADVAVNPDLSGRPSPLVLRVYQLKRELQFRSSDFFALYDNDTKLLADDLVGREEYMVNPGTVMDLEIPLDPATRHLAFLGAFRDLDSGVAKVITPVDATDPESIYVLLGTSRIQLLNKAGYRQRLQQQEGEPSAS